MIALTTTATPSVMHNTSITKRPKLSLQTSSLPITFGSSNTGITPRTCIPASPTIRNTFSNSHEIKQNSSAIDSPSPCRSSTKGPRQGSSFPFGGFQSDLTPYQQPLGVRSILRNSPLKRMSRSISISTGAGSENRRVYFPVKKQVSFRKELEEEVKTIQFVARHSDIEAESEHELESDNESDSGSDSSSSQSDDHSSSGEEDEGTLKRKRKSISSERQIRAAGVRDGFDNDRLTETLTALPDSRSRKRQCKWRWTIDNLASTELDSYPKVVQSA